MTYSVVNLSLNVVVVLAAFFVLQVLYDWNAKLESRQFEYVVGAVSSIAAILCMALPFREIPGYLYDLRALPVFVSFLYGGRKAGALTTCVMLAFRFYVGGHGAIDTAFEFSVPVIVMYAMATHLKSLSKYKRVAFALALMLLYDMEQVIISLFYDQHLWDSWHFFATYTVLHFVAMLLGVYPVEHIRATRSLKAEVMQTEQLRVVTQLAASIAHEVRNPMTTAKGFAQLLQEDSTLTAKQTNYAAWVLQELERAQDIISEYLSFARGADVREGVFDVSNELTHVANLLTPYATIASVQIRCEIEPRLWVMGSPPKMRQSLTNLAKNAIEAIPSGGIVVLRAHRLEETVEVQIIDNGEGMTQKEKSKLGTPFFTTKKNGTGLGVMMVYRTVKDMQGTVHVVSTKGKGTVFTLCLPAYNEPKNEV